MQGDIGTQSNKGGRNSTEYGEPIFGQSSNGTLTEKSPRKRTRRVIPGTGNYNFRMIRYKHCCCCCNKLIQIISVNSQNLEIGSDDTSNDYTDPPDTEFVPSETGHDNYDDLSNFAGLVDQLEAQRMRNSEIDDEMALPNNDGSDNAMDYNLGQDGENEVNDLHNWVRLQEEELAAVNGRLTAPQNEIQRRRPRKNKSHTNDSLVEELRGKQLALVDEQIHLHKIQQESVQERSKQELALIKTQRQIAEIEMKEKEENAQINKEEAQERLHLIRIQRQIAEIELKKKQNEL